METTAEDLRHMRHALELAEQARGTTGDNPWVGCVLVKNGTVIGAGHTHPPGQDHAEAAAIRNAESHGHNVQDATAYCTLEPCSFHGRTPSCAKLLVRKGIARVVVALRDPHPKVNGAGLEILRKDGITVTEGLLAQEVAQQLEA
ncbi:MAG: bifunctional diaminohydroxyphosphoribosylaminopyrimidine deaminase/5-amino-6-(5-phosphoribosylamino)uracil reductase RibD [SAR324 cluster bacterium]|nr:bifunctional diaminohydroxyphosphoribosylaminopyrimidine deaminase/5-amino-6-(5-phosphoribosylamino)uracil reductase RibD [SAR324 cluster bacterium]